MHIPDKYRDRYEALAQEHPWMREMVDGTNGDGGETNGIHADAPLVDEPTETIEPVEKLRDWSKWLDCVYATDDGKAYCVYNYKPYENMKSCGEYMRDLADAIADMIERDYVGRDGYDFVVDALKYMKAERDELKRKLEIADRHEFESDQACDECKEHTDEHLAELIADRDEWKTKCETCEVAYSLIHAECHELSKRVDELTAERDEWKAKYLGAMNDAEDYKSLWMHSRERSGKSAKRAAAVERLRNFEPGWGSDLFDALLDGETSPTWQENRDALIDLLTDDDGVTNLEWLFEHDRDKLRDLGIDGDISCYDCPNECVETEDGTPPEECQRRLLEWLRATHVDETVHQSEFVNCGKPYREGCAVLDAGVIRSMDAQRDANGTCPDGNGTASDDCGQIADRSEKSAGCVRNDGFMSEVGGRADDVDVNDANATYDNSGENVTHDIREKLEADVRGHFWHYDWCRVDMVLGWLDRQAAITRREVICQPDERDEQIAELQGQVDSLTAERERNRRQIDHLTAQCYEMDGLTATAKIRGLQRKVDSLTEQKDTLISYVEADGTRYSEVDGNQVFDHSDLASGDYREEWHRVCVERDDLARTLGETMAEREMYRDLCGQMLDAMDDIRAKVDASFPRGAKEVM